MREASKFFLLKEPPSADHLWLFHTHGHGTLYIYLNITYYLNIKASTSIAYHYTVPNVSNSDAVFIFLSWSVTSHSAGCSSTWLTNFLRYARVGYVSPITLRCIIGWCNCHKIAAQKRKEDYVIYEWVSTWLSLDPMQGSWRCPRESIKWRHGRLAWCGLTAPRGVNMRAASRITRTWSRSSPACNYIEITSLRPKGEWLILSLEEITANHRRHSVVI